MERENTSYKNIWITYINQYLQKACFNKEGKNLAD